MSSASEATRRLVDLSLVLDVSSSIGPRGRRSATRRAASSTRSTRTATAWRSSPTATAPRCSTRCRRPRVRQGQAEGRRAQRAAGRHHRDGGRALSRLGRAALGARRPAVRPARHRALHRRRVQQRPGLSTMRAGVAKGASAPRLPEAAPGSRRPDRNNPQSQGLSRPKRARRAPARACTVPTGTAPPRSRSLPYLPLTSAHTHHRSAGIPTSFPLQSAR